MGVSLRPGRGAILVRRVAYHSRNSWFEPWAARRLSKFLLECVKRWWMCRSEEVDSPERLFLGQQLLPLFIDLSLHLELDLAELIGNLLSTRRCTERQVYSPSLLRGEVVPP